jgi:beta-phosphoglucomutase
MSRFEAAIFDLDGVLADSARSHFVAWKRIADALGIAFDEQANEALKGIDRMGSLRRILEMGRISMPQAEMENLAARKNGFYIDAIAEMTPADLLPGTQRLLDQAQDAGLKCAVASASRNAPFLLKQLGIAERFDFIADAGLIERPKPAPDIFLACAAALRVAPQHAVGFEDAAAGIAAIKAAGMYAVGIGDAATLAGADIVYPTTDAVDLRAVLAA